MLNAVVPRYVYYQWDVCSIQEVLFIFLLFILIHLWRVALHFNAWFDITVKLLDVLQWARLSLKSHLKPFYLSSIWISWVIAFWSDENWDGKGKPGPKLAQFFQCLLLSYNCSFYDFEDCSEFLSYVKLSCKTLKWYHYRAVSMVP